jgi:hypothetical protein
MFEQDSRHYYEVRAAHATGLGDRAASPKIAALHYELALRYAILSVRRQQSESPRSEHERVAPMSTPGLSSRSVPADRDDAEPALLQA